MRDSLDYLYNIKHLEGSIIPCTFGKMIVFYPISKVLSNTRFLAPMRVPGLGLLWRGFMLSQKVVCKSCSIHVIIDHRADIARLAITVAHRIPSWLRLLLTFLPQNSANAMVVLLDLGVKDYFFKSVAA